jgi:nucleotide-binding universal stress UspA family protein
MNRILVPVDFSENSLNALEFGIKIANKLQADLRIMHVRTKKLAFRYTQKSAEAMLNDSVENWLDQILRDYKEMYLTPGGKFDYRVREGNVFKEVSNQARYDDTTLIVIGTHGASGFEDKYIGSNAYRLVHSAPVPVLTVRPEWKWRGISKVILPISFEKSSRQKIPAVIGMAKLFDAKVFVVGLKESGYTLLQSRVKSYVKQAVRYIEKKTNLQVESTVLSGKNKAEELMAFAQKVDADIVASDVRQGTNPFGNFFKPFANQLINESESPVLIVPTKESLYLHPNY